MTLTVKCFCGAVVETAREDGLAARILAHASSVLNVYHSHTDVLAMANIAED